MRVGVDNQRGGRNSKAGTEAQSMLVFQNKTASTIHEHVDVTNTNTNGLKEIFPTFQTYSDH